MLLGSGLLTLFLWDGSVFIFLFFPGSPRMDPSGVDSEISLWVSVSWISSLRTVLCEGSEADDTVVELLASGSSAGSLHSELCCCLLSA